MSEIIPIKCGNVNCFIVFDKSNNSAILVDTGRTAYREMVLEKCKAYPVKLIMLTHGHMDHCENAFYLSEALQIPVAMNKRDFDLIPDNMKQPLYAKTVLGKLIKSISIQSFHKNRLQEFKPEFFLEDGMGLDGYGINAKIVALPGHTNGSVGLQVDDDKLIVGDALMNMFYPTVSMLYTNEQAMKQSAVKIGNMGKLTIYFGHGKPLANRIWIRQ